MPPIHIAVLFESYPPHELQGTAEVLALEVAGCRVTAVSLSPPVFGAEAETGAAARTEVLYPPQPVVLELVRRFPPDDAGWRAMAARAVSQDASGVTECLAWYFTGVLRRRGVQLIHVAGGKRALRTAVLMRQSGMAFSMAAGPSLAADAEVSAWLRAANLIMASGDAVAAALCEVQPEAAGKIVTIRPGIDASRYPAALCGGSGAMRVLLSPGESGTPVATDAMGQLHALGLEVELSVLTPQSAAETKRQLASADVYLHGGCSESGLLEAMAAGLPVVSLVPAGEALHEGRTGWQTEGNDPAALTARLAALAEQPAMRSAAGQAGLDRVQTHFSLGRRAARMTEEFRRILEGRFSPALINKEAGVLCLLDAWPLPAGDALLGEELRFLSVQPAVDLMAARLETTVTAAPPAGMEFLPDAPVLENSWQQHPELAGRAMSLRSTCPEVNGEDFLLHARRAVYLASLCSERGWRHVHAMRSNMLLTAWLLRRIARLNASAVVELGHALPVSALALTASAFQFGSSADTAFTSAGIGNDLQPTIPPAKKRLFSAPPASSAVDVEGLWKRWLGMAREKGD